MKLSTGIKELDCLLGGSGFVAGSTVLIRGAPGTGKTTLALQIAANVLASGKKVLFACLENNSLAVVKQIQDCYAKLALEKYLPAAGDKNAKLIAFTYSYDRTQSDDPSKVLDDFWNGIWEHAADFVILDSLPAFIDLVSVPHEEKTEHWSSDRQLLAMAKSYLTWRENTGGETTALLISEEKPGGSDFWSDSFLVDTVIRLYAEEITPDPLFDNVKEEILYCKVLKGRGLPIQRRSCCYDFMPGRGIQFFDTYPATGLLILFAENAPQRNAISGLRTIDVPSFYPGLGIHEFDRAGLQRMFSIRRRAKDIPSRKPMVVSSVDEYWITVLQEAGLLAEIRPDELVDYAMQSGPASAENFIVELRGKATLFKPGANYIAVPYFINVSMLVYRKDLVSKPPDTWEELEMQCVTKKEARKKPGLLIETTTYDSLLATVLELCWSHGADWGTARREDGSLEVTFRTGCFEDIALAIERLRKWIHAEQIVSVNSSVDPRNHPAADWTFARHWYSTLVDLFTATDATGQPLCKGLKPDQVGVAPIPVSQLYKERGGKGLSTWGEWYLVEQAGTENHALAVNLVNNLTTSGKVVDRALTGAGLPAVESFYTDYRDAHCIYTDKTFHEMRTLLYSNTRTRTAFCSYRHVARILYGCILAVMTNPHADVRQLLAKAFSRIDARWKENPALVDPLQQILHKQWIPEQR
ncbi:MAG TPA: extracellular solute-binding protein [Gemmataceae bacterium]|nr:extracellular solute-binding protein [Gemmataceae bacterium]